MIFRTSYLFSKFSVKRLIVTTMAENNASEEHMINIIKKIIPDMKRPKYKGQDGRIGIFGGSIEYTGAPYYTAMSALRTGADLVHIFCAKEAAIPIKSLSPEPIVHPFLNEPNAIDLVKPWLDRLHVVVIGPGLGRDNRVFETVTELLAICRQLKKPVIIDADGLFLIQQKPDIIKDYPGAILTPNAIEFTRLCQGVLGKTVLPNSVTDSTDVKHLAKKLGNDVTIFHKGSIDIFADGHEGKAPISCNFDQSGRRCGGQGDLLCGALAVFWYWSITAECCTGLSPSVTACYAASRLTRECNKRAYKMMKRGMLTTDMLEQIPTVFAALYEGYKEFRDC